jgi:hypothetical protein
MSALGAAHLALGLLLTVCLYAGWQLARGGLDVLMRLGIATNLVGAAFVWLRSNKPVEGRTLLLLATDHGITSADCLVLLPAVLALALLWGQVGRVSALLKRR